MILTLHTMDRRDPFLFHLSGYQVRPAPAPLGGRAGRDGGAHAQALLGGQRGRARQRHPGPVDGQRAQHRERQLGRHDGLATL